MDDNYMKRCYELAISAGKKGYDTFGAVLVFSLIPIIRILMIRTMQ